MEQISNKEDKILIRKSDGSNINLYGNGIQNMIGIDTVDNLNMQVIFEINKFLNETLNVTLRKPIELISGDITLNIFDIMRYRRCTIFLCKQNSIRGNRYIAYISTKILHFASSFGTSQNFVYNDTIILHIKKYLTKHNLPSIDEVEELFGLE
jgi:hypothetical protein